MYQWCLNWVIRGLVVVNVYDCVNLKNPSDNRMGVTPGSRFMYFADRSFKNGDDI